MTDNKQANILIIESQNQLLTQVDPFIQGEFSKKIKLSESHNLNDSLEILKNIPFNIIILDLDISKGNEMETFQEIKSRANGTPIIIIGNKENINIGKLLVAAGAEENLIKEEYTSDFLFQSICVAMDRGAKKTTEKEDTSSIDDINNLKSPLDVLQKELKQLYLESTSFLNNLNLFESISNGGFLLLEGDKLVPLFNQGETSCLKENKYPKNSECLCGYAASTKQSIIVESCIKDNRYTIKSAQIKDHGYIIIPIKSNITVNGILYFITKQIKEFTPNDTNILNASFEIINQMFMNLLEKSQLYDKYYELINSKFLNELVPHNYMEATIVKTFEKTKKSNQPLSVIVFEIDNLEKLIQTYGTEKMEKYYNQILAIVADTKRGTDIISKVQPGKFLILLVGAKTSNAANTAERIRTNIADKTHITISAGIASNLDYDVIEAPDLIRKADNFLHEAQKKGTNSVVK